MSSPQSGAGSSAASPRLNPVVAWLGWTILLAAVVAGLLWFLPSAGIWGLLIAVGILAALNGRWSFVLAPLAAGLAGLGWIAFESMRDHDSQFAINAGYQWAVAAIIAMVIGSMLAAALGVAIGRAFHGERSNPAASIGPADAPVALPPVPLPPDAGPPLTH